MSTKNVSLPLDKMMNEDSIISNSTTISITESITQDISKNKNVYLISKTIEQRIIEILSYLQSDSNLANNKIPIVKYLQSLFMTVEFNSEIFMRKYINDKEKLNLYKIIIYQYIYYTNPLNSKTDEENYRSDLQTLFLLLLSQVTFDKECYHYILSSLIRFINEKNISNLNKKNLSSNNFIENEPAINFKSEHLKRVLHLLKYFYGYYKKELSANGILNYYFFSGDSDSNIIIRNKEHPSDPNKKILNLDETLCVMMYIKMLPPEYVKAVYPKNNFKLLELKFLDKKNNISININKDNQLISLNVKEPLYQLAENETNCILIKFTANKKKTLVNCEIYIGFNKVELPPFSIESEDKKIKEEIKEIALFKNFIGTCSNIIIYKEKKNEGLPKFLSPWDGTKLRMSSKGDINDNSNNSLKRQSTFSMNTLFPDGIYNEELYSYFVNAELKEQLDNQSQKYNIINSDQKINYNIFQEFLSNNIIAIYIPTRHTFQNQNEEKINQSILNQSILNQIILIDSINGLNAEFNIRTPGLNGIHIFHNLYENDLALIGGINNFLPILELMLDNKEFLNLENFASFFDLLTVYIFCPKFQGALLKEKDSNFFKQLSYFLEKMPYNFFNDELSENFRTILGFLCPPNNDDNFLELNSQFHNYILMNEKILLKFNENNQKNLLSQICNTAGRRNLDIDIIKIIKIMLYYDRNRKYKFCCKEHSKYFNDNYSIMEPELSFRLQPIIRLIEIIFDKTYKTTMNHFNELNKININNKYNKKNSNKNVENHDDIKKYDDNNLYYLFYVLTYSTSPCLKKSIINLLSKMIKHKDYENFLDIFDKKKELFAIILFVFKTSIFDIKMSAINLLLLIDKKHNWNYLDNKDIKTFIQNEIFPIFLLDEVNTLPGVKNNVKNINKEEKEEKHDNNNEIKNEINDIEIEKNIIDENDEKNVDINALQNEKKLNKEINNNIEETEEKFGLRNDVYIRGIKYELYSPSEAEQKISKKYNKKKYKYLVFNLYEKIFEYFDDAGKIFDLLIKTVSNSDLFLISTFIKQIGGIIQDSELPNKKKLYDEIVNNNYFLQFILDTYLQFYILKNKGKDKIFVPGFSLDIYKNSNSFEEQAIPFDEEEKKNMISNSIKDCKSIYKFIISEDITKLDFVLTWGKYYEKLKEENDIYNFANEIINDILTESLSYKNVTTFSETSSTSEIIVQSTLYFFNICFEFISFFNLKYNDSFFDINDKERNKILENDIRYILLSQKNSSYFNLSPVKELEEIIKKVERYPFINVVFKILYPILTGGDKKILKEENEIYTKYMCGNVNKNTYIKELEFLFHSSNDIFFNKNRFEMCNKGAKIINVLYLFFNCILNIGGSIREINENFKDLRLYLILLIISPSSINLAESAKKKKWPNDNQNKEVQTIIQYIIFNAIFFLYNKLKDLNNRESEYNIKLENEKDDETKKDNIKDYKKNLESISQLKRSYIENLGYILKLLNKVYRGVKEDENQNTGFMNFFKNKNKIIERIKNTGAYLFINKLYDECFIIKLDKNFKKNIDSLRKYTEPLNLQENEELIDNEKNYFEKRKKQFRCYSSKTLNINNMDELFDKEKIEINKDKDSEINMENKEDIQMKKIKELDLNLDDKDEEVSKEEYKDISPQDNKNNNNDTNNTIEEKNYLDYISCINFTQVDPREITISEEDFRKLEIYINEFLEDPKVQNFYESYFEICTKDLYSFTSSLKKREENSKTIIPLFDNRKNISRYPYDLCLVPFYYHESSYKKILKEQIEKISKLLKEEIKLSKKIMDVEEYMKEEEYRNTKKKMFKFRGIWSNEDFFYDSKKYKLKYKLLNHFTSDLTKILMTPITDIDYYLPKFSLFKGDIFRNELSAEPAITPVTKVADICFNKNKINNDTEISNNENQGENISNDSSMLSNINEVKEENSNMIITPLYEFNIEYYSFMREMEIKENEKTENLINNFNQKDFDIFTKFIEKIHFKNKAQCLQCEACLVKLPFHIKGIIYINETEIGFYSYEIKRTGNEEDYDSDKKVCFGSVFKDQSEKYNNYYLKIPFNTIELILKRRYYFKRNVLEIFTDNKKSYFFRIDENKFNEFYDHLKKNNQKVENNMDLDDIIIENSKTEEKIGLINKNSFFFEYNNYNKLLINKKYSTIKNLYYKWTKWEISTFTLLNYLNLFSSRSYHDVNQYPVFPWIITDYTSQTIPDLSSDNNPSNINNSEYVPKIRPFNTPMGMLEINELSRERKENYEIHFQNSENDPDENGDRYGSHYSTSLYLTYYLVRVFPFSYLRIEIQGKNFDDPNRLFNSLSNSFECATSQKADLRELIPEFFCFPEMFYNINDLNLGEILDEKTKNNKPVNDITMPPWTSDDAYTFIKLHREMLESVEISEKIHEWFNIIFGSKQKGKIAKKIHNLFIKQTYDDFDDVHKKVCASEKIYQNRMVEFGVTPSQVFKNDVDKRLLLKNLGKKPILYDFQIKKKFKSDIIFQLEEANDIKIRESELYVEGDPYKIFSSWKKDEEQKNEKILFLYPDKVKIISKSEKGFFKKTKSTKIPKEKETIIKEKQNTKKEEKKEKNDTKEEKEIKEETNENKEDESVNKENKIDDNSIEDESSIKDEESNEINDITSNKDISKYDRILLFPKYRLDMNQTPSIIYDKGNYIALGGFWNGQIIINKLDENEKNRKNKTQKIFNIISTNKLSPITNMKTDDNETFAICGNKIGCIFIYSFNKLNKIEWNLYKIIQDHQKEITSLDFNSNLNIFISCDKEGYNNLYTFPQCKLFNSYKLTESQLPTYYNSINDNNSSSISRSESNTNIFSTQADIYADIVIISHCPLPCIIFYIHAKKILCSFSINFHFMKAQYNIDIVQNGIKKYSDYFRKDYLFIYNKKDKCIDVYDTINLELILRSSKIEYTFIDFHFSKEMEHALILVRIDDEKTKENNKDKNTKKNYKILLVNTPGKVDGKST